MTTTEQADQPPDASAETAKPSLVFPKMWVLFVVLICCFTAWGVAADLTTPMVAGFKRIFDMSTFQASLVQLAYFGAYFLLAIPAAFINQRFGYKAGLLTGLLLAAAGAFAFYPASKIMTYEPFLVALFAIAAGCSILETSANPYVLSLGPEETATRRLNFAQAFNPPPTLLDAATYRVKAWGVPTGSHRGNVLWFNQRVLREAGVAAPGPGYTPQAFGNDLATVAASGRAPLCLGGKDRFTATELFENTLLGVIGPDGWARIHDDSFDWRGSQLREALTRFGQVVSQADPNAGGLTWDQAAKKLATGECAFLSMNDSVYGELVANRVAEGQDFGYVPYPGTAGAYLAIVDTFVVSADATDGPSAHARWASMKIRSSIPR